MYIESQQCVQITLDCGNFPFGGGGGVISYCEMLSHIFYPDLGTCHILLQGGGKNNNLYHVVHAFTLILPAAIFWISTNWPPISISTNHV